MLLTSIPLQNYQNINSFVGSTQWTIRNGEANTLYFRLADIDQEYLRYLPLGSSPTMTVTFTGNATLDPQIPGSYTPTPIVKTAVPVDAAHDLSLWMFTLLSTDVVHSGNVFFTLNNGGVIRSWVGQAMLSVELTGTEVGGC